MLLIPTCPYRQFYQKFWKDTTTKKSLKIQSIHFQWTFQALARSPLNHKMSFIVWREKFTSKQIIHSLDCEMLILCKLFNTAWKRMFPITLQHQEGMSSSPEIFQMTI